MRSLTTVAAETVVPLYVDVTDPCFFDHPLDHLPGMLLVSGLLDLVRAQAQRHEATAEDSRSRLRISMTFDRIAEPGQEVLLHCRPVCTDDGPAWQATAEQDGNAVASALIAFGGAARSAGHPDQDGSGCTPWGSADDRTVPAEAALVHRQSEQNILLGAPRRSELASVLVPPAGHRLSGDADGPRTPEALIESARQLTTLLGHTAHGRELDAQMLWLALDADLPTDLPTTLPLALRWDFTPSRGSRAGYFMVLIEPESGREHGRIEILVHTISKDRYRARRAKV